MPRRDERSWGAVLGDGALTVAAVLGAVCIALVIVAAIFDVRIILFSTGSMSPTIPAGSAAIVRHIPADEIAVGDVVTVDRPGKLPITHRVTSVAEVPDASAEMRRITMRGDANAVDDPLPYDVERVRLVVGSVPGIAPVIASMGNPWVLGTITVCATVLVVWVFWPRRDRRTREREPVPESEPESADAPGKTAGVVTAMALLLAVGSIVAAPHQAHAASGERIIQGEVIRLISIEQPQMRDLLPGGSAAWEVGVSADAPTPGTITVLLSSLGDPELALQYEVLTCPQRWVSGSCPTPTTLVREEPVPLDGVERSIQSMTSTEQSWLRVVVAMPATADPDAAGAVDLTVRAVGMGDDVSTGPGGALPATGAQAPWLLAATALVLAAAGAGVYARSRVRP
ncbi:S26 family signal peptidase [Microbacterium sp. Root166]|uniref:S26 family signal peptidase n=1 Tax=Microbacterium sp. Root166 TaxID=1736478 RepID=UPI000A8F20E2|nr:S26 family signal peptidase [Microbacterium sp. Root166]